MTDISKPCKRDDILWNQFREGVTSALGSLFKQYYDDLFAYGMKLIGDEELVRDDIQDLFVKLWESRSRVNTVKQVRPYIIRAFHNLVVDQYRIAKRNPVQCLSIFEMPDFLYFVAEDFNTENGFTEEQITKLLNALNDLSPRVREAIYLRYFTGLSSEELATVMNVTLQSTRNLVCQGIKSLKEEMLMLLIISECGYFLS